jgi:predicted dehydrogenase
VGLFIAQVLLASGCRVAAFDLREDRLAVARKLGIERLAVADILSLRVQLGAWSMRQGFEHVFIAAASRGSEPVAWAVQAAADRAKLIVVGDVRTDLDRAACYRKELTVIYARSYGPGRYDPAYEERGVDYPREHVRWSLRRNLEAYLDLVARGEVRAAPLITHRFPVEQAQRAYEVVAGAEPSLGVVLEYHSAPPKIDSRAATLELRPRGAKKPGIIRLGFIGAGNYAASYLMPALKKQPCVELVTVCTARGISARTAAGQFGFARCTTDSEEVIRDSGLDAVVIATRHDTHARLATAAVEAGKAVFVEKPLAIHEDELDALAAAHAASPVPFLLGHNRRFAPATRALREFFGRPDPEASGLGKNQPTPRASGLTIRYAVHAGPLPPGHWLHDPAQGGRIVGECCHFVDWCCCMVGSPLEKLFATTQGEGADQGLNAVLTFMDGSVATIFYDSDAHPSLPKESIEISAAGRSADLVDFVQATFLDGTNRRSLRFQGKGQSEMVTAWARALAGESRGVGSAVPPFASWVESARATLKLTESASSGMPVWFA